MIKTTEYRYTKSKGEDEKSCNIHIREMIEMIKNEEVRENLYVKAVKLSTHAFLRMQEHFNAGSLATASKMAKDMLKHAVRIGTVLAYDGRINVLYAYRQTAFFLSPDLKTLVTVNKYNDVTYRPLLQHIYEGIDRETLIDLHFGYLREIELEEQAQMQRILTIEEKVRTATAQCASLLELVRGRGRKYNIKQLISDQNFQLKQEGRKLFELKTEKRHVCKSLVSLY
jgi:hypothetical protein